MFKPLNISNKSKTHVIKEGDKMSNEGTKHDNGKTRYDLISPVALEELANVLAFGAKKYDSWNWSKGLNYTRVIAAILRHTFKYLKGETLDEETGLSHMASVMCNAMFLLHFEKLNPELDDRPKEVFKKDHFIKYL